MKPLATVVEWDLLLEVVYTSLGAGIGVTVVFSLGILGATRFTDMRRDGRLVEAGAFAVLMAVAFVATTAVVVFGIVVMTQK